MRDHSGAAGIVDQDIESALGRADRSGEAFDCAGILDRRAAGSVAGAGQAGNQAVGRLGVAPEGDDNTRPRLREQARGRGTQAFAAACHQRYPSVEHAHDLSFRHYLDQKSPNRHRTLLLWRLIAEATEVSMADGLYRVAAPQTGGDGWYRTR